MGRTQKYGITFPIQVKNGRYLLDLNKTHGDDIKSQLVHLIFTPEGQRLRQPQFGTNLIQYLFNPNNDDVLFEDVVMHIKDKVNKYIVGCDIIDVNVDSVDEQHLKVQIKYSVREKDGELHYYDLEQII